MQTRISCKQKFSFGPTAVCESQLDKQRTTGQTTEERIKVRKGGGGVVIAWKNL